MTEPTRIERYLMLDLQIHPDMTLAEFHERHGISYEKPEHDPHLDPDRSGGQ